MGGCDGVAQRPTLDAARLCLDTACCVSYALGLEPLEFIRAARRKQHRGESATARGGTRHHGWRRVSQDRKAMSCASLRRVPNLITWYTVVGLGTKILPRPTWD